MGSERRYLCERCGGTGHVIAGCWNPATKKYDSPAGACDHCGGSGELGVIKQSQPTLDLEALLAIVRRRTPGEWQIRHGDGIGRTSGCESHHREFGSSTVVFDRAHELTDQDAAAIVAAVNNFEAVAERCKRAETDARVWKENAELAAKACVKAMEQRDELFKACKHAVETMGAHGPCTRHSCSDCKATWKELNALVYGVKGGTDGK